MRLLVDQIYIINLRCDVRRKEHMIDLFQKHGLDRLSVNPYLIFDAIDWRHRDTPGRFQAPPAAYGCLMSHLACIRGGMDKGHEAIMIMEDDTIIHKRFWDLLGSVQIPDDWEILYLSGSQMDWRGIDLQDARCKGFYRARKTLGGTCYILRGSAIMQRVLDLATELEKPIDEVLVRMQQTHVAYVIFPNLFMNYMNESHIRSNNAKWKIETMGRQVFRWNPDDYDMESCVLISR